MKILHLTLKKLPFDVMVTGEKQCEIRKPTKWILSRLLKGKQYDVVRLVNGYGSDKPSFDCVFCGFSYSNEKFTKEYSNGLSVDIEVGDVLIHLGKILSIKNIITHPLKEGNQTDTI